VTLHLKYANAMTGGEFVCSMYCQACDIDRRLSACRTLASNLAVAGALCESFTLGNRNGQNYVTESEGCWPAFPDWTPGCGRRSATDEGRK
jgi:hypothetical protein